MSTPRLLTTILVSMLAVLACCAVGCATHADRLRNIRAHYHNNELGRALADIDEAMEERSTAKEQEVLLLDRAMVELASGRPQQAEQTLRNVRDRLDDLEQRDPTEIMLAMVNDDTSLTYPGEDYEKILLRAMLSLSNLMHDGGDARAYGHQVAWKQEQIVQAAEPSNPEKEGENPKLSYKRVALGSFLCGILDEQNPMRAGEAQRGFERVVAWEPNFSAGSEYLQRSTEGRHSAPGNGVVYVFALTGRGPHKVEVNEENVQMGMFVAETILNATSSHVITPSLAPVKVPQVVLEPSLIDSIEVQVDGRNAGRTETITDVGRLAVEQYEAIYPRVVGRAIARRAIKRAALYAAQDAIDSADNGWVGLAFLVGGIAWDATENADTRCWGLLPEKIQVLRIELPAGQRRIGLTVDSRLAVPSETYTQTVDVVEGRNTYVMGVFHDANLTGQILVNTP
jgi:uncharacterized protein